VRRRLGGVWVRVRKSPAVVVLLALVGAYVVIFGWLTWRQQSNYGTFGFDMGIFDQGIWLLSRFHDPFVTVRGLNFFGNHVNPNVALLVPFYWLGAGPHFLYLIETVALAAGAIPVWLLGRDAFGDRWAAVVLAAAYLLFPALEWINWWHFHPEALAVTPLLFAVWLATKHHWGWYAVCVVLVLTCKEDAPLTIIALGALVAVRNSRKAGAVTAAAGLAWLVIALKVVIPHATGYAEPFYIGRAAPLGRTPVQIVFNTVVHPSRLYDLARQPDRRTYYRRLLLPLALVPLTSIGGVVLALPQALVNTVSSQATAHSIRFHYSSLIIPGLFVAVVDSLRRLRSHPMARWVVVMVIAAASVAANVAWSPSPIGDVFHSGIWALHDDQRAAKDTAVHMVPANAAVSASYSLVPHLTHRVRIYEFPNPWHVGNWGIDDEHPPNPSVVDYLVLDLQLNIDQQPLVARLTGPGGQFKVIFHDGTILVARRQRAGS